MAVIYTPKCFGWLAHQHNQLYKLELPAFTQGTTERDPDGMTSEPGKRRKNRLLSTGQPQNAPERAANYLPFPSRSE